MVSASERRDSDDPYYKSGDEEIDPGLMRVRMVLHSLPKARCPEGFEYRLQQRVNSIQRQPRDAERSWTSGWMGVGLGFACAAVIALFVFDFDTSGPVMSPVTNSVQQVVPAPVIDTGTDQSAGNEQTQPGATEPDRNMANSVDTVKRDNDPAKLPDVMQVNENQTPGH